MQRDKTEMGFGDYRDQQNGAYTRSTEDNNGTIVAGMDGYAPGVNSNSKNNITKEPVVGFLYSISRQGIGEYWPLHLGRNTIGRADNCDIALKERTVSELHASLNIKQMKTTKKMLASVRDEGAKNGLFVNEEELGYDSHPCVNGDIITIGLNYKLLVILIDAEELGLSVSKDFIPVKEDVQFDPTKSMGETDPFGKAYSRSGRSGTDATTPIDGVYRDIPKTEYMGNK